ncbi:MAG TPA: hypothetical protein VFU22_31430 [Roseiflexaceae bacterium]|nr:hypothetical protein [Roseiflexaceae bacterium]
MTTFQEGAAYLLNVGVVTLVQLFALGGPALLLIYVLSLLSAYVERFARTALGSTLYQLLFGWVGTAVHETGHLLAALLFLQPVKAFRPFTFNSKARIQGIVVTQPNYGNLYQYIGMFFIGIAPVLFGALVIFLASYVLFHDQINEIWRGIDRSRELDRPVISSIVSSGLSFLAIIFNPRNWLNWRLYLFLYIAFAVGSSIHLSGVDIANAKRGCLPMIVILFLFNTVLLSLGAAGSGTFAWLTQYYTFLYILLCFVILVDLLAILILWLPAVLRSS